MSTRRVALAAALFLPSFTAFAQEPPELFSRLDTNKDGYVAADEVPEAQKGLFERLVRRADDDGDKKLSKDEFQKGFRPDGGDRRPEGAGDRRPEGDRRPGGPGPFGRPGGPPPDKNFFEAMFDRTDSNSDGKLTKDEVPEERQGMRMIFERVGGDSIDKEQFVRGMLAMSQNANQDRRPGDGPPDRPRDGRPGEGRPADGRPADGAQRRPDGAPGFRPGGPPGGGLFAALDTNRDGELSNAEIVGAGSALLKLDRNSDGKITPDEVMGPPGGRPGEGRPRDGDRRAGDRGPGDRGPGDRGPGDRGPREGGPRDGERPRGDRPLDK